MPLPCKRCCVQLNSCVVVQKKALRNRMLQQGTKLTLGTSQYGNNPFFPRKTWEERVLFRNLEIAQQLDKGRKEGWAVHSWKGFRFLCCNFTHISSASRSVCADQTVSLSCRKELKMKWAKGLTGSSSNEFCLSTGFQTWNESALRLLQYFIIEPLFSWDSDRSQSLLLVLPDLPEQ